MVSRELMGVEGLNAEQTEAIKDLIDEDYLFYWLMQRAKNTASTDDRLDLFGEAMVLVEKQSGDDALCNIGRLAIELLKIGEQETAEQLLVDAYRDHSKLQRILDEGKREKTAGVARIYLPVYAMVQPERAMELIRLTAFPDEGRLLFRSGQKFKRESGNEGTFGSSGTGDSQARR
ncbi:hypothetical protein [Novipirellula artificiosorum]|uniref:Tetratricopeptide repeat protein n=1 Tax=Novipirellula artificiosorum TaxID=2528016 RepID=A0A5C6E046_9BACT|nr:hypothetical protein [Novipirellula artificiosorum]TWU42230.1 hypothetical protein Poly41_05260 [Novipirellula artificiosorum]